MLREAMFLVMHGVPFEVQEKWSRARRWAACVAINELHGRRYDWSKFDYEKPE